MTAEQLERWRDFAVRMARTCWSRNRRPYRKWILDVVCDYFETIDGDEWIEHVVDYSNSTDRGWLVCDDVTEYLDGVRWDLLVSDDGTDDYDRRADLARDRWDDQWAAPVRCCIRAGLDAATGTGPGVLGFTAGELRRMYPEGVPPWAFPQDEPLIVEHLAACAVGMVRTREPTVNGTFAELRDDAQIWL